MNRLYRYVLAVLENRGEQGFTKLAQLCDTDIENIYFYSRRSNPMGTRYYNSIYDYIVGDDFNIGYNMWYLHGLSYYEYKRECKTDFDVLVFLVQTGFRISFMQLKNLYGIVGKTIRQGANGIDVDACVNMCDAMGVSYDDYSRQKYTYLELFKTAFNIVIDGRPDGCKVNNKVRSNFGIAVLNMCCDIGLTYDKLAASIGFTKQSIYVTVNNGGTPYASTLHRMYAVYPSYRRILAEAACKDILTSKGTRNRNTSSKLCRCMCTILGITSAEFSYKFDVCDVNLCIRSYKSGSYARFMKYFGINIADLSYWIDDEAIIKMAFDGVDKYIDEV